MDYGFIALWDSMGIANLAWNQSLMIFVGAFLIFLAIRKGFEPLLLLPIGFGCILANIPVAGLAEDAVGQLLIEGNQLHLEMLALVLNTDVESIRSIWKDASFEQIAYVIVVTECELI